MNIEFGRAAGELSPEQLTSLARALVAELEGRRFGRHADMPGEGAEAQARRGEVQGYREELKQVKETLESIVQIQAAALTPEAQTVGRERLAELGALGVRTQWREGLTGTKGYRVYAEGSGAYDEEPETVYRSYSSITNRETLEAGRISDYFKRDSRRYDGGFERY